MRATAFSDQFFVRKGRARGSDVQVVGSGPLVRPLNASSRRRCRCRRITLRWRSLRSTAPRYGSFVGGHGVADICAPDVSTNGSGDPSTKMSIPLLGGKVDVIVGEAWSQRFPANGSTTL